MMAALRTLVLTRKCVRQREALSRIYNSWTKKDSNVSRRSIFQARSIAFTTETEHPDKPAYQATVVLSPPHELPVLNENSNKEEEEENFQILFENSQFARVMNPVGKRFRGEVIAVVDDNLYIDFGFKFHAVVKAPKEDAHDEYYCKGTPVVVQVKSLELTDHFLGQSKHISLLEAEAELIGLLHHPPN